MPQTLGQRSRDRAEGQVLITDKHLSDERSELQAGGFCTRHLGMPRQTLPEHLGCRCGAEVLGDDLPEQVGQLVPLKHPEQQGPVLGGDSRGSPTAGRRLLDIRYVGHVQKATSPHCAHTGPGWDRVPGRARATPTDASSVMLPRGREWIPACAGMTSREAGRNGVRRNVPDADRGQR